MTRIVVRQWGAVAMIATAAAAARGQCTGGTPPPCAPAHSAAARRVDPPLDDRTWIVVPFNNITRAQDVDWLRDASVNLLYLDLSRWQDIHVVDDARVADLVRQVPEARVVPLSFEAATAVARRAGAGRLVMGNVIKQGSRTTVAAKVFDVRRGTLIRSPQQDLVTQDSLMPVFGRLAQAILNVAAPSGANIANVGTSRVDAYQEYLAGSQALNRFDFVPARAHLSQALKLDSTFALAHYKMAILIGWDASWDTAKVAHAAAAARLSGALPARERTLMKGLNAFEQADYGSACETYGSVVRADSNDVDALYGVGECSYHDSALVPLASDTTQFVFRGNWNTAIRVFERALRADPTFHLAFQHIFDILTTSMRAGNARSCPLPALNRGCRYAAYLRTDHDTLVIVPVPNDPTPRLLAQSLEYQKSDAEHVNLLRARDKARAWASDAPDENRANVVLGHILVALGDADGANRVFAQLRGRLTEQDAARIFDDRVETAVKLFRGDLAWHLIDSAYPRRTAPRIRGYSGRLFGKVAAYDSLARIDHWFSGSPLAPPQAYQLATERAALAGGSPIVAEAERVFLDSLFKLAPVNPTMTMVRFGTVFFALDMPRSWPALDYPSNGDHRIAAVVALSRGDTARLRAEARAADSVVMTYRATIPDSGVGLFTAQAFLVLHDSVAALRIVRRMLDTTIARSPLRTPLFRGEGNLLLIWPRLALLRADLEAAVGSKAAGRVWYKRFLDLWEDADPEFAPLVNRARAVYAALPPPTL